jgi:site-specific DNA-cytosine methylase
VPHPPLPQGLEQVAVRRLHPLALALLSLDLGELGGLAQHRNRFLLVARHMEKVPPFLYEPPKRRIRGVGEVLDKLPLPGDPLGGPMHTLPNLHWKTWVRLALIRAGYDWRDLENLDWENYGVVPETAWHSGIYGVTRWDQPSCTVTGRAGVTTGRFSVADPRAPRDLGSYQPYGVVGYNQPSHTVTGRAAPGAGAYSVADPRLGCDASNRQTRRFNNVYRMVHWDDPSQAVTAGGTPSSGGQAVADPRVRCKSQSGSFRSARHYGVVRWADPSLAVVGHAKHDNGAFSVADPRLPQDDEPQKEPPVIISLDGTRHRPFTTFELAALQGFPVFDDDGAPLVLEGKAHGKWRESIGNAVPPPSAKAIADVMGQTLLLSRIEMSVPLPDEPVWVKELRIALSVEQTV